LEQRGSFAGRAGLAVGAVCGSGFGQAGLVGVELLRGDVAGVGAGDEGDPFLAGSQGGGGLAAGQCPGVVAAEAERSGVTRVVQDAQDRGVLQGRPVQLAFAGSFAVPAGEGEARVAERFDAGPGRAGGGKDGEQVREGLLDGGIGVEDNLAGGVVGQADGQRGDELTAAGLGQDAAAQPGPDEVQFSLLCRPQDYAAVALDRLSLASSCVLGTLTNSA
jgi:hypothetical protein